MKKYLYIVLVMSVTIGCNAQSIVPLFNGQLETPANPYYKDVDNDMNPFIGEWKWQDGDNSWTIQFQKAQMVPSGTAFEDVLFGEYQYVSNGTILINELPLVPNNLDNLDAHNLWGGHISISYPDSPSCELCPVDNRFIVLSITDPSRPGILGEVIFTHYVENGSEKMKLRISKTSNSNYLTNPDYDGPNTFSMPEGDYTFIKQ